jgi:hypothetical protein
MLAVFMMFITDIFQLLMEQTNMYYQQNFDKQAGRSCISDVILLGIVIFLAFAVQMGHYLTNKTAYEASGLSLNSFVLPLGNTMTRDRFLHILQFLHFVDNSKRPDQNDCDWSLIHSTRPILNCVTPLRICQWTR